MSIELANLQYILQQLPAISKQALPEYTHAENAQAENAERAREQGEREGEQVRKTVSANPVEPIQGRKRREQPQEQRHKSRQEPEEQAAKSSSSSDSPFAGNIIDTTI